MPTGFTVGDLRKLIANVEDSVAVRVISIDQDAQDVVEFPTALALRFQRESDEAPSTVFLDIDLRPDP